LRVLGFLEVGGESCGVLLRSWAIFVCLGGILAESWGCLGALGGSWDCAIGHEHLQHDYPQV
jgi:hypothetical protein